MKKIVLLLFIAAAFTACKQKESIKGENGITYTDPAQYNDYIVTRQTSLVRKIMDFSTAAQTNLDTAASLLGKYEKQTAVMIDEIKGMPPYNGDSSLRETAIRSFNFYKRVFKDDYKQLIDIRKAGGDQTEEGVAEMNRIVENLSKEEEVLDKAFHAAQRSFATKHKMKLMDNEMQKKIDKMNE